MNTPKLIALDMDGTLLDGNGQLPPEFPRVVKRAKQLGVTLAPASGRQLSTLEKMFPDMSTFIAENGTVVVHGGEIVGTTPLKNADVHAILQARESIEKPHMTVLCTPSMAYAEKDSPESARDELDKYYKANTLVDSLTDYADEEVIKIAIFCAEGTEEFVAPVLYDVIDAQNVAISGQVWVDCMPNNANKGVALEQLAEILSVDIAQTAAFGDFLNDYELLKSAGLAVAMENAHEKLKEIADRIAPPNTEYGVITVLDELLGT
ncbi:HAD family hydrolase [Corynebacterium phocae]|uniref:HAD family hydrolase n=1 Tax=Corynebacterium phocae TaxID=161895 RepID=UPI001FE80D35|nr:HAD family hydrolase [Corynebacterium phocae]